MSETTCERQVVLDYYLPEVDDMLVYSGSRGVIQGNYSRANETVIVKHDSGKCICTDLFLCPHINRSGAIVFGLSVCLSAVCLFVSKNYYIGQSF